MVITAYRRRDLNFGFMRLNVLTLYHYCNLTSAVVTDRLIMCTTPKAMQDSFNTYSKAMQDSFNTYPE